MTNYIQRQGLQVDPIMASFIEAEVLPGLSLEADKFWQSFASLLADLTPQNRSLLQRRDDLQAKLDSWNVTHKDNFDAAEYKAYLYEIGYLVDEGEAFAITTENVDSEIASQAGPQLVVPTSNARFALNATNARWGSMYDALYGTNAISEEDGASRSGGYNPLRGAKVIAFCRDFLNAHFALLKGSHADAISYRIEGDLLQVGLEDGSITGLANADQCRGYRGEPAAPTSILLQHNGLHVAIEIDPDSAIGQTDKAGVKDLTMEAALTTIQDFEDSVAAVDAQDKVGVYRNWLGLMKGDLADTFDKGGQSMTRVLNEDKRYTAMDGSELVLHGRSLLFCRNVGHLMSNPAILDQQGEQVQEGIMDAMISVLIAMHDLAGISQRGNSRTGSVYIVKPKMHGPDEVAFANILFNRVEDELGSTLR